MTLASIARKRSTPLPSTILISRTDSIGDVMLTLPMLDILKEHFPSCRIIVLGREYTAPVLRCCVHADEIITLEELRAAGDAAAVARLAAMKIDVVVHVFPRKEVARWCKEAGIPLRIGTSHRAWHWITCNKRVHFSRRRSPMHEAQLNLKLLAPLGIVERPPLDVLADRSGFAPPMPDERVKSMIEQGKRHVILHPGSGGSAGEWGLANFAALMRLLDLGRYQIILTGTAVEAERYRPALPMHLPHVTDAGGMLALDQLIALIGASDALVAASTGPLHIAAACGIQAIGLFGVKGLARWAPLGRRARALVSDPACARCAREEACDCVTRIAPARVVELLDSAGGGASDSPIPGVGPHAGGARSGP
ncbi:MAG TPA: glycosyltransferase family 9 protein [Gemmatimonadaceae bacterium]|nr:glycosyltransferase family 9 protein [Gemmatimonadaceae bacterium]